MGVAVFDYAVWAARYPELAASVDATLAGSYFTEAGLYLDNTDASVVQDVPTRLLLLNMLVAHIAILNSAARGGLVGRVSTATEGSVTVNAEMGPPSGSAAWFLQTAPGASFWQATATYRTMRYAPGPRPFLGVPGRGRLVWPQ